MIINNQPTKLILIATGLFTLIAGILIYSHPPAIFPDAAKGFQVMRGMQMGGSFNMLSDPDAADIAKNSPSFLAWWSPGQYLVPYVFISLLGISIGQAIAITATLCSLLGLGGLYFFFKKIGFTPLIAATGIAFIACQQAYMVPYVFYNGGEILLFAFTGWFLYGCVIFKKAGWPLAGFILIAGIIGFICKSSFLWIFFSGCLYIWISTSYTKKIKYWIVNGLSIGMPAILLLAIIYNRYLSKGATPASDTLGIKLTWETFTFPLASPLLAGFSADDLCGGLVYHIGPAAFSPAWTMILLILCAIISLLLIFYIARSALSANYKLLLILFYSIAVLFFGISFLRQSNISYEARHMRIIGLIIVPGIIYLISKLNISYRIILGLVWVFIGFHGFKYLYKGYHRNTYETAHGSTGIAQLFIDQATLNYIQTLDEQERDALFVFISPDLGLEINHNRIITFNPVNDNLEAENIHAYNGHAGHLYLILPQAYAGAKAAIYLQNFPGYQSFKVIRPGKGYLIYSAE